MVRKECIVKASDGKSLDLKYASENLSQEI